MGLDISSPRYRPLTEGWAILAGFGALAVVLSRARSRWAPLPLLGASLVAAGLRDPERRITVQPGMVVAPADGRVIRVQKVWDSFWRQELLEIVMYLSLLNVHVQRMPLAGVVVAKRWRRGAFHSAASKRAELENLQLSTYIRTAHGPCVVKQRTGLVARRIVNWVEQDDELQLGDRLGMIKFGSQAAVCMPTPFEPLVAAGSLVKAGITPVARLADRAQP